MTPHEHDRTRRIELAKLHIARKNCGLDDDAWIELVVRVSADFRGGIEGAVTSSGEMNAAERRALLNRLTKMGFRAAPPRGRESDWIETKIPHLRKVLAQWFDLVRIGAVQTESAKRSLRKFVKKMTGVDNIQWLTAEQANAVIEACKGWKNKFEAAHQIVSKETPPPPPSKNPLPAKVKAAAYEIMRRASEVPDPAEGINRFLTLLSEQTWSSPEIETAVAELVQQFGPRAHAALLKWNYSGVRKELILLIERVREQEPLICERLLAQVRPDAEESATAARRNEPKNRKHR